MARRFEDYAPDLSDRRNPEALAAVREAVMARSEVERTLATVVVRPPASTLDRVDLEFEVGRPEGYDEVAEEGELAE